MSSTGFSYPYLNWLKSIDMFGAPIRLHIHQQTNYKTIFSGLLSLAVIVIVVGSSITMLVNNMFYSTNSFLSTMSLSNIPTLDLNGANFVMALQINDPNFDSTKSFYNIDFQQVITSETGSVQTNSLGTVECTKEYLEYHLAELSNFDSRTMFCPQATDYPVETLLSKYIQISIKKCENRTDSVITCASETDVENFFSSPSNIKSFSMTLFLTNNVLDMLNTKPKTRYLKQLNLQLPGGNLGQQKEFNILQEIVNTDDSMLNIFKTQNDISDSFYISDDTKDQILYADEGSFLEVNIKKSEYEKKHQRSFTKIEEMLAFVGGLAKALVIIVSAIAIPFNEFYYNMVISNEIYEFESRPKKFYKKTMMNPRSTRKSKTFSNLEAFTAQKEDDPTATPKERANKRLIHNEKISAYHPFFESLLLRHHKLEYTLREAFKSICCCKKRNLKIKKDLYNQAKQRLRKDVDVITILKKLQDVDKLKELLLTEEQLELFNYKKPLRIEYLGRLNMINNIPLINKRGSHHDLDTKPTINRKSFYLHDRQLDTVDQFKDLFEAYKVIARDISSSAYNFKLIQMLGRDTLSIFNKIEKDYQEDVALISDKPTTPLKNKSKSIEEILRIDLESPSVSKKSLDSIPEAKAAFFGKGLRRSKTIGKRVDELEETYSLDEREIQIQTLNPKFPLIIGSRDGDGERNDKITVTSEGLIGNQPLKSKDMFSS